ncbi:Protein of unknown function (DUF3343) [Lachnospiraceae bacterium JC7]|nr:Protein of unknown function (DUF3343) [Lachnospiraceae bacterium JC7]
MRQKELKLVMTFHTTSDAMAFEKQCKTDGAPGRMIPVPRAITAGCGLSWCASPDDKGALLNVIRKLSLSNTDLYQCMV